MDVQELHASLTAKGQRAKTDGEDVAAALRRTQAELAATLALVAACRQRHFPAAHIKLVEALVEPDKAAVNATQQTVDAIAALTAAVGKATAMAAGHLELDAAGAVYRNGADAPARPAPATAGRQSTAAAVDADLIKVRSAQTPGFSRGVSASTPYGQ